MTRAEMLTEFINKYKLAESNVEIEFLDNREEVETTRTSMDVVTNYRKSLLAKFSQPAVFHQQRDRKSLCVEISEYFEEAKSCNWDTEVLSWWGTNEGNFPTLAKLARLVLAIPATSAAAESAFSISSCVITAKRSKISPFKASQILFIHDNYNIVQKYLLS